MAYGRIVLDDEARELLNQLISKSLREGIPALSAFKKALKLYLGKERPAEDIVNEIIDREIKAQLIKLENKIDQLKFKLDEWNGRKVKVESVEVKPVYVERDKDLPDWVVSNPWVEVLVQRR